MNYPRKCKFLILIAAYLSLCCTVPPTSCQPKEIVDRIDYAALKAEMRSKYRLPPKAKDATEEADTRKVLGQLELLLKSKKTLDPKIVESPETKMNRKMDITTLEYAIDHLGDSIPEIREQKKKARKEELKKVEKESDGSIHLNPLRRNRPYSY